MTIAIVRAAYPHDCPEPCEMLVAAQDGGATAGTKFSKPHISQCSEIEMKCRVLVKRI